MQVEHLYNWTWAGYNPIGVGWENCDPGHSFGPAVREFYTIHFVLSGTGTYIVKGKEYHPTAGDIFVHAPYETVYWEADSENPWNYVWINFAINGDVPYRFENPVLHAPQLRTVFHGIQNYPDHRNTGRDYVANCLLNIANQLSTQRSASMKLVDSALLYIHNQYNKDNFSISGIAAALEVSRVTLANAFMLEKQMTAIEYLIRFRLEKAVEYMTIQKLSPSIAAYSVGFKTYPHFAKTFTKYYGVSPKEYQKRALQNSNITKTDL